MFNSKAILSKAWVVPLLNMFKAQHVIFKGLKGNRMAYLSTILILWMTPYIITSRFIFIFECSLLKKFKEILKCLCILLSSCTSMPLLISNTFILYIIGRNSNRWDITTDIHCSPRCYLWRVISDWSSIHHCW